MGKFICTCGSLVRTSGAIPNPNEWHLIGDEDFDPDLPGMDLLTGQRSAVVPLARH